MYRVRWLRPAHQQLESKPPKQLASLAQEDKNALERPLIETGAELEAPNWQK